MWGLALTSHRLVSVFLGKVYKTTKGGHRGENVCDLHPGDIWLCTTDVSIYFGGAY